MSFHPAAAATGDWVGTIASASGACSRIRVLTGHLAGEAMLSRFDGSDRVVNGALAAIIAVLLVGGIIGAFTAGGDSAEDRRREQEAAAEQAAQEEEQRRQAEAEAGGVGSVEADQRALEMINANQDRCNNTYIPNANARAEQALRELREQRDALQAIADQLPPGKAKDSLASQIAPGFESGEALIQAELRAVTTDCQLAFTVFQLTRPAPESEPE